jgi:diguanylate cyclase (GGDEF)-like protein/PAS domain S-box-containing protein
VSNARILILDSDLATRADVARWIESVGFQSILSEPGLDPLDAARQVRPDAVLLDVDPGDDIDGVAVGELIHEELGIPVVLIAPQTGPTIHEVIYRSSAYGCITRPLSALAVCTTLEVALQRHRIERAHEISEKRFRLLFDQNPAGVMVVTGDGRIIDCNAALATTLGYETAADLRGRAASDMFEDPLVELERRRRVASGETVSNEEVRLRHRDGRTVWAVDNAVLVQDPSTGRGQVVRTILDITERKGVEEVLQRLAYRDDLTGLPNRRLLELRSEQILAEARRRGEHAALVFLDLVGFKSVNDKLGHRCGDDLIVQVAKRVKAGLRQTDAAARFGGDEFLVLMSGIENVEHAKRATERLLEQISGPIFIGSVEMQVRARAGVAVYPEEATTLDALLAVADRALTVAKAMGGQVVVCGSEGASEPKVDRPIAPAPPLDTQARTFRSAERVR